MKIHVCLVSAQAAANLLPALDPGLRPDRVILVTSSKMRQEAANLGKVMQEVGVAVERCELSNEHDYSGIEARLLELASSHEADSVALNITGGTKFMSLVAQSVATLAKWQMFYVDADTDQVVWLHRDAPAPHRLDEHLRLRHYLQGYGFTPTQKPQTLQVTVARQTLIDTLLRQIGSLEAPLSQLNWLAQQAEDKRRLDVAMDERQRDSRSLEALLRNFEDCGSLCVDRGFVRFNSEDDRDFVKGGWLEAYVSRSVSSLGNELGIRDNAVNLELADTNGVKSELDIAFLARNRLFIIECKTARMDKPEAPKANDTLFKLAENSKRIGGLGTRNMLASYRALRDSEKRLAGALGIELVCGADLLRLNEKLGHWVG